ncbi:hypothetical protein WN51_00614 [Melipona quadrifasciata]|uniref:Uncharacterized protein n=1 Tax=Melipona quadrifasciata TaxID=166423 RepID=A0A0M8ZZG8_9HYME|nr:hypothetical protein WN51_00614 [Melipona quadrifasciata]
MPSLMSLISENTQQFPSLVFRHSAASLLEILFLTSIKPDPKTGLPTGGRGCCSRLNTEKYLENAEKSRSGNCHTFAISKINEHKLVLTSATDTVPSTFPPTTGKVGKEKKRLTGPLLGKATLLTGICLAKNLE